LLDEERPEVRELPGAGNAQDNKLYQCPSHHPSIRRLGLVSEFSLAFLPKSVVSTSIIARENWLLAAIAPLGNITRKGTRTYPLEHLLPSNIVQPRVQIHHFLHDILDLAFVSALESAGLADGQVEGQLDTAHVREYGEPGIIARVG
jgi:hypothetical protein